VERSVSFRVNDGGPWWHGVSESRQRTRAEGVHRAEAPSSAVVALVVGLVWGLAWFITLEMYRRKVVDATSRVCAQGAISGL
jgi:hypothetical protein